MHLGWRSFILKPRKSLTHSNYHAFLTIARWSFMNLLYMLMQSFGFPRDMCFASKMWSFVRTMEEFLEIMRLHNFGHVLLSLSMPKSLTMNNTSIHLLRYCSLLRFYDELLRLMEDGLRSSKVLRILYLIEFFKSKLSYKIKG